MNIEILTKNNKKIALNFNVLKKIKRGKEEN